MKAIVSVAAAHGEEVDVSPDDEYAVDVYKAWLRNQSIRSLQSSLQSLARGVEDHYEEMDRVSSPDTASRRGQQQGAGTDQRMFTPSMIRELARATVGGDPGGDEEYWRWAAGELERKENVRL